jgi:hypothetical protein
MLQWLGLSLQKTPLWYVNTRSIPLVLQSNQSNVLYLNENVFPLQYISPSHTMCIVLCLASPIVTLAMTPQSNSANTQTSHLSPIAPQLQNISPLVTMSSIKQATTLLICSLTASADLWIEPRETLLNDGYFLPRSDPVGLPGYGANDGFSYLAQNEQSTGTSNRSTSF